MGESMVLEKNENYWDAEDVTLDKLTFRYVLDTSTALTYEGGEVDGVQSIPSSDYASDRKMQVFRYTQATVLFTMISTALQSHLIIPLVRSVQPGSRQRSSDQ